MQITTLRIVFEEAMQRLKQNPDDAQARLLARQTAPPRPREEQKSFALVIVLLAGLAVSILLARVPSVIRALHGFPLWIVFAVPGVLLTMATLVRSTLGATWNQKELPNAVRAWADRYVCRDCGMTFTSPPHKGVAGAATATDFLVRSPAIPAEG